jgi:SAM-dependent methyltransferase
VPAVEFTAHNIELAPGECTMNDRPLIAHTPMMKAALRTLRIVFGDRDPATIRVADLGCLEGAFAVEFARAGYQTLGIEGRAANYERCQYVGERLGLANLQFVLDDVRNVERHGTFDATFCAGLLYHLDEPVAFLSTLGRVTTRVLLLQTHYAPDDGAEVPWALSEFTANEGRRGRWFVEWPEGTPETAQDPWASVGNYRSFWLGKRDLLQAMSDAGFTTLFEQYDFLHHQIDDEYITANSRSLFVGVKQ